MKTQSNMTVKKEKDLLSIKHTNGYIGTYSKTNKVKGIKIMNKHNPQQYSDENWYCTKCNKIVDIDEKLDKCTVTNSMKLLEYITPFLILLVLFIYQFII
jgi:hypothetical protein